MLAVSLFPSSAAGRATRKGSRVLVLIVVLLLGFTVAVPGVAEAQPDQKANLRPEIFVSASLWDAYDYEFFTTLGVGAALHPWSRVSVEFEVDRPREPLPPGWYGTRETTIASANVSYFFAGKAAAAVVGAGSRLQPFLTGGVSAVWWQHRTLTRAGEYANEWRDTVIEEDIGGGVLIPLTRAASVRPEIRWYGYLSRRGPALIRASISAGYRW